MRAAKRLGDNEVAIVKACAAAEANSTKAGALLDAVPSEARRDLGYVLCRLHWLLRRDNVAAAASLVLAASREDLQRQDTDEWWRERRVLARKLLDLGEPETAYRVVREAASPANPYYRAEFHFMAGWIALRFLADPATALEPFRACRRRLGRSDRAGACRLLARPRRRGGRAIRGDARAVRGRRPLSDRLLWPAGTRPARPRARSRCAARRRNRWTTLRASCCTPPTFSTRSASATLSCRS